MRKQYYISFLLAYIFIIPEHLLISLLGYTAYDQIRITVCNFIVKSYDAVMRFILTRYF